MNTHFLEKLTAIEIDTAIASEIVEEIFIPWEVYQEIYPISRHWLSEMAIAPALHDRYLQLRRQLELAYCLLQIAPTSKIYDRASLAETKQNLTVLARKNTDWENLNSKLPSPLSSSRSRQKKKLDKILSDRSFLTTLRQLGQSKANLDRRHSSLQNNAQDIVNSIYARTAIDLAGKIVNRYSQSILESRDRQSLLQLHQQSVNVGEKQWRELLKFVLDFTAR